MISLTGKKIKLIIFIGLYLLVCVFLAYIILTYFQELIIWEVEPIVQDNSSDIFINYEIPELVNGSFR